MDRQYNNTVWCGTRRWTRPKPSYLFWMLGQHGESNDSIVQAPLLDNFDRIITALQDKQTGVT